MTNMPHDPNHGSRPVPDPTTLTTQALDKALLGLEKLIEARLNAMDGATKLLQARADKVPSEVDTKVGHLQALHEEKFRSIALQFQEWDKRSAQILADSKAAGRGPSSLIVGVLASLVALISLMAFFVGLFMKS